MRLDGQALRLSPTDLAAYSACGHRTLLDRLRALGLAKVQEYPDPRLELIQKKGIEHERAYLSDLEAEGKTVVRFGDLKPDERNPEGYAHRAAETLAAMRQGPDVIYQGTVYDGTWLGFVDFLLKVDTPSDLGGWSYEVADAKLAREAKATAILQTCVYSEMLARVQGVAPERIHIYLGGPRPRKVSFRLAHFAAYYRALKARFLEHVAAAHDTVPVAPDPVDLCQICDWRPRCKQERVAVDHLSLVAGIGRDQRHALETAGVTTLEGLARLSLDAPPAGMRPASFRRIREQARVQLTGRERGEPYHEVRPLDPDDEGRPLGLAALPEPSPHDLFFDFEGADYAYDEGLEYLWGVSDVSDQYEGAWALTQDEEKAQLDRFLGMAVAHVADHPGAHIYHYGHYEPTALKRLVARYGIRTDELDQLLRGEVFVDLHRITKQGVLAGVESYSIKALEEHYGFERAVPMRDANPARGRLEFALAMGLREEESLADGPVVEGYNRDDCVSTRALRDWLERLRQELEAREGHAIPRSVPNPPPDDPGLDASHAVLRALVEGLLEGIPEDRERTDEEQVRWLAAHLVEWHRREDKSAWWEYFRLKDLTVEELVEEGRPLAGLEYEGVVGAVLHSQIHRYRFPPQEHRLKVGKDAKDPHAEGEPKRRVWALDEGARTVDLKVGGHAAFEPGALRALFPDEIVRTKDQRARLRATAEKVAEGGSALAAWSPVSPALLRRALPSFDGGRPYTEIALGRPLLERAVQGALLLDEGVLPVQGPPGTGKTYSGARMIRALLRAGRTVGVTGPSHKVIANLVQAVCDADTDDPATPIEGLQASEDEGCADPRITVVPKNAQVPASRKAREEEGGAPFNLIAGTGWLWSRDDMAGAVDVLFIDEAGQFSLANALAVAPAAKRMVLLGDPQQLNQPLKGIHPPGTELSVLERLAGEGGILTPERGLFLGETWRMRPEITAFTSELFYEGKLEARSDLSGQRLTLADGSEMRGLHLATVEHVGNSRESAEEAAVVVALFHRLLGGGATFTNRKGETAPLGVDDVLVVAPYNAHVSRISSALAAAGYPQARVGTVDKFQGQEAPVALYSLASSSAEDAPRGMDFLYALDRLNVATSRARVATVVVASPRVFTAECKRPEQMRMVNGVVRFGEMAGHDSRG